MTFTTEFMQIKSTKPNPTSIWEPLDNISPTLICSVVKAEDRYFFRHSGFDLGAIARATKQNLLTNKLFGASTITQQLSKNLTGGLRRGFLQKLFEAWYSLRLELQLTKKEILEFYLNSIEWDQNIWGIKNASLHYFKKTPDSLSLEESLILASLIANPDSDFTTLQIERMGSVYYRVNRQLYQSKITTAEQSKLASRLWREKSSALIDSQDLSPFSSSENIIKNMSPIDIITSQCGLEIEIQYDDI